MTLDARNPSGPIDKAWEKTLFDMKLVNPANKRKHTILVIGSGLAGASAAASLGELGYNVRCFCFQDSPRRAHSIAAQGGINAAKNYQNDGDSVYRLFYDTVKGGDFRSREANVYRLAENSVKIIDQCVAQGVPFAREYGGIARQPVFRRRAGFAHLLRARPDGPAAFAGRLPGAGAADPCGQGQDVSPHGDAGPDRHRRAGARHRHAQSHHRRAQRPHGRRRGDGQRRLRQRLLSFDQRQGIQRHRDLARATSAARCSPILATRRSIPPAFPVSGDYQSKLTLMSESLRNDGRIWVRKKRATSVRRTRFPPKSAIIISSAATRALAISFRATWLRATRRTFATKGAAWARPALASISTSRTPFRAWASRPFASATATCSICTSASRTRTLTRSRCASIPPFTTPWAACGWTTTCKAPSPGCLSRARRTSLTTEPTAWARARSCRGCRTATSSFPTRSAIIWPAPSRPRWTSRIPRCARR